MATDLQILETLSTNLFDLKTKRTLDEKCIIVLDTLRKTGWKRTSLSFLNEKFETTKTLYSGYTDEEIQHYESTLITSAKRKKLISSTVERWRVGLYYYLPWREERVRSIISDGMTTDIPIELRAVWNPMDMLYAPIFIDAQPVAIIALDQPRDGQVPNKVSLRVPNIMHALLTEVLQEFSTLKNYPFYDAIQSTELEKGVVGFIELSHDDKVASFNHAAEKLLRVQQKDATGQSIRKILAPSFTEKMLFHIEDARNRNQIVSTTLFYPDENARPEKIDFHFFPLHILYHYNGMVIALHYPDAKDIYKMYSEVLMKTDLLTLALAGPINQIEERLIQWLMQHFSFDHPRLYRISADRAQIICEKYYGNLDINDIRQFDQPFNRNSLAVSALLENETLITTRRNETIRDNRRIWQMLKTIGSIAIPMRSIEGSEFVLQCDLTNDLFELDMAKSILFKTFASFFALMRQLPRH